MNKSNPVDLVRQNMNFESRILTQNLTACQLLGGESLIWMSQEILWTVILSSSVGLQSYTRILAAQGIKAEPLVIQSSSSQVRGLTSALTGAAEALDPRYDRRSIDLLLAWAVALDLHLSSDYTEALRTLVSWGITGLGDVERAIIKMRTPGYGPIKKVDIESLHLTAISQ